MQGAAAMSLSAWEQQALNSIKDRLAASDPKLTSLLNGFSRLASGEEMPARETIQVGPWRASRPPRRKPRRRRRRRQRHGYDVSRHVLRVRETLGSRRPALLLWLVITTVLIAVALAFNVGNTQSTCTTSWAMGCANPAPAPSSPAGGQPVIAHPSQG
jgi:hypothetical protein